MFYGQPGPSGIPSPELGSGPQCPLPKHSPFGPLSESNPLPSETQSLELGAGPVPAAIALPTIPIIPITKQAAITMVFLFIYFTLKTFRDFFLKYILGKLSNFWKLFEEKEMK
jgi:hypothetical protein